MINYKDETHRLQQENESLKTQVNDLLASKDVLNTMYCDLCTSKNIAIAFLSLIALLELILLSLWVFA